MHVSAVRHLDAAHKAFVAQSAGCRGYLAAAPVQTT